MRLFESRRELEILPKIVLLLACLFSFLSSVPADGQNRNEKERIYIDHKLSQIDSLIESEEFDKAQNIIDNTQNTFSFKKDLERRLEFEFRKAQIMYEKGESETAIEKLLTDFDQLKTHPFAPLNITYASYLAKIFANNQNLSKAISYSKIALSKSMLIKDTVNTTISLIRIGSFYYARKQTDSAEFYFRKVTHFPVTPKTEVRIANAYNNLGVIAQNKNNFDLAKGLYLKAKSVKEEQKDTVGIAYAIVNLGNVYHYEGNFNTAIHNYQAALRSLRNQKSPNSQALKRLIYDNLSVSYDSLKDYENAYRNVLLSRELNDQINREHLAENLAEVEAKYNLALEEQRTEEEKGKAFRAQVLFYGMAFITLTFLILAFIFYKNYKLTEQNKLEQIHNNLQTRIINATIDAKEKERKSIAEILHDSVSALLSSANLHLQASRSQLNGVAPIEITKAQEIVNEASVKIRDLSHELISSVLLKFGLAFAVHDLCEKYSNSELELISDDNGIKRYDQKFEIKIYNIIEELINNIIKHSKARNASINLIERNGDKLIIQIIDDGKGFDVKGARRKDGLGLSHIDARIKIMKGVFNINSKVGEGTSIFISVPIHQPDAVEIA
jgi:signal transduction histidine kinase